MITPKKIELLRANLQHIAMMFLDANVQIDIIVLPEGELPNNPDAYLKIICDVFDITERQIRMRCRKENITEPRKVWQYLLVKKSKLSLKEAGIITGGYDHATVINSIRKCEYFIEKDADFRDKFNQVIEKINQHEQKLKQYKTEPTEQGSLVLINNFKLT